MKPEDIIELAKKAGFTYTDIKLTAIGHRIETFAALHREALIESGELVPREKVEADKRDAERKQFTCPLDGGACGVGGYCDDCNADVLIDRARSQP